MVIDFSKIDFEDRPVLMLKNSSGNSISPLSLATNLSLDIKYDEMSVIEFDIPEYFDNGDGITKLPYYDEVIGMRVVDLTGIGQFKLMNPEESTDGVKSIKSCKAYSLEYEFTFKNVSFEKSTYNFWNPVTPDSTVLGTILELMPSWHVGYVDKTLVGKYRTFEASEDNLYNFIKSVIQKSYNCIFEFDTYTRAINVRDVSSTVPKNPVYISVNNLAKEIKVEENTENIATRLDVTGAEGVNIRDVNPSGTNYLINLDYFMNTTNFSQELIDKYNAWKELYKSRQLPYYNLSIEYSLLITQIVTENSKLTEIEGEMTSLENQQAVIIQGIAKNLLPQSELDEINKKISAKQVEINAKKEKIETIRTEAKAVLLKLQAINKEVNFKEYFTADEYLLLDRYFKDSSVSESSFVVSKTKSYEDSDVGYKRMRDLIEMKNAKIANVTNDFGSQIYDIKGGMIAIHEPNGEFIDSSLVSAVLEVKQNKDFVFSAYLGKGNAGTETFPKACVSYTGVVEEVKLSGEEGNQTLSFTTNPSAENAPYLYFTMNTSEYEKRSVEWDLYEYGKEILEKVSQPSFTFDVTSANFIFLKDFEVFKNELKHGQKIYIELDEDKVLSPICVGVKFSFDNPESLVLEFSDTYTSRDSSFIMADLLEKSVSAGKKVDFSKFTYSAFIDSGASTEVRDFMTSALDVSKNAIISSKEQAITWGDSGIRLRKWTDESRSAYDDKQMWLNNNSILMTKDNWNTAELAIGNFYDPNFGDCWGIVAPNIAGTLIAGENLIIESAKKDGDKAVFKVDAEGCFLHNSTMSVTCDATKTQILLDPVNGILIGKYPLYKVDETTGEEVINEDNKVFYADDKGNLTLKGTIYAEDGVFNGTVNATDGKFTGRIEATSGFIGSSANGWTIDYKSIWNGKPTFNSSIYGTYIGTDGISMGYGDYYIRMNPNGYFSANNANISGIITTNELYATGGTIGGFTISGDEMWNSNVYFTRQKMYIKDPDDGYIVGALTYTQANPPFGERGVTLHWSGWGNYVGIGSDGSPRTYTFRQNEFSCGNASIVTNSTIFAGGGISSNSTISTRGSMLAFGGFQVNGYMGASKPAKVKIMSDDGKFYYTGLMIKGGLVVDA